MTMNDVRQHRIEQTETVTTRSKLTSLVVYEDHEVLEEDRTDLDSQYMIDIITYNNLIVFVLFCFFKKGGDVVNK